MDTTPLVSCVITTYNRASIVKEAIDSTIAQTYKNWELIIVDDQSTDHTWEVIKFYKEKDKRIRCYNNPNKGANYARNLGIEKSMGKYIAFLDDDDVSLPHRFESQVKAMVNNQSRFIVSWHEVRDRETGKVVRIDKTILKGSGAGFPSRWMIEKSLLEEVGGFNPKMKAMQEIEMSYRLAAKYTFEHHADIVTIMYDSYGSTSKGANAIMGKRQLIEEVGHLMFPEEVAFWSYSVSIGSLSHKDFHNAIKYFRLASKNSTQLKKYYLLFVTIASFSSTFRLQRIGCKLISSVIKQELSPKVQHRIIN